MLPEHKLEIGSRITLGIGIIMLLQAPAPAYIYFFGFMFVACGGSGIAGSLLGQWMANDAIKFNNRPCEKCGAPRKEGEVFYGFDHWCPKCQREFSDWCRNEKDEWEKKCHVCKQWFYDWEVTECDRFKICRECKERSKTTPIEVEEYYVTGGNIYKRSCR